MRSRSPEERGHRELKEDPEAEERGGGEREREREPDYHLPVDVEEGRGGELG